MRPTCLPTFPATCPPRAHLLTDRTATSPQRAAAAISTWLHQLAASICSLKTWTVAHQPFLLCPKIESFCSITFFWHDAVASPIQVFVSWIQEVRQTWRQPSTLYSAIIKVQSAHCFAGTCTPLTHQRSSQVCTTRLSNGKDSFAHYPVNTVVGPQHYVQVFLKYIHYLWNLSFWLFFLCGINNSHFFYLQAVPSTKGRYALTPMAAAWQTRKGGTTSCPSITTSAPPLFWCSFPTPVSIMAPPTSRVTADHPWRREKPTSTGELMSVFPPAIPSWVGLKLPSFLNFSRFSLYVGLTSSCTFLTQEHLGKLPGGPIRTCTQTSAYRQWHKTE